jgi:hypothetical protein
LSAANPFASDEEVFMFIAFPDNKTPERLVNTDAIAFIEKDGDEGWGGIWITTIDGSKLYSDISFEEFKKRITQ